MAERTFHMSVMGKTIEHLGSQLYKRRDAAIAELVANCWDAGADKVEIQVPAVQSYDRTTSEIVVTDTGKGMTADEIEDHYLKIGRNRRIDEAPPPKRTVMGRKGIGKLAGFGIASEVELRTWRNDVASSVVMHLDTLKQAPGDLTTVDLPGSEGEDPPKDVDSPNGSRVVLRKLKHVTAIVPSQLRNALARRFSRTVHGVMEIYVNGELVEEPEVDLEHRVPNTGMEETTVDGETVRYFYGFSKSVLTPRERRGFVVFVHGKTAQAPPYFFEVEATATGQHGTKYLFGAIEADYLDDGVEDDDDVISTDRQEIDWEAEPARALHDWGDNLTRRALRELRELREEQSENWVIENDELGSRIDALDSAAKTRVRSFVRALGRSDAVDQDRVLRLADGVVAAFEYRHFHDLVDEMEEVAEDPDLLVDLVDKMLRWKVLESRALLEVVDGRLSIVDLFHSMIVDDAPETAPVIGMDNLHDLLSSFPWLLNPDWQTFDHERKVTEQLREWRSDDELDREDGSRVDFLALSDGTTLVVVEIKRPGHAVAFEEYQRLQRYMHKLRRAWADKVGGGEVQGLLVCTDLGFDEKDLAGTVNWERWADLCGRVRHVYDRYRDVLKLDVMSKGFHDRQHEVRETRRVLRDGTYRNKTKGKPPMGPSDVVHDESI